MQKFIVCTNLYMEMENDRKAGQTNDNKDMREYKDDGIYYESKIKSDC